MDDDFLPFTVAPAADAAGGRRSFGGGGDDPSSSDLHVLPSLITDVPAPWMQYTTPPSSSSSPFVRLHNEILTFCDYITPTQSELSARDQIYAEMVDIVKQLWPEGDVVVFGSQMTKILIPTSDLDLVVHTKKPRPVAAPSSSSSSSSSASSSSSSSSSTTLGASSFASLQEEYEEREQTVQALVALDAAIRAAGLASYCEVTSESPSCLADLHSPLRPARSSVAPKSPSSSSTTGAPVFRWTYA